MSFHSKLAGYDKHGHIWVNSSVPERWQGHHMRHRLIRHESVEYALRKQAGYSYRDAHKMALRAEHKGMTKKEIQRYEGYLGSVAHHYPPKRVRQ
jgi:hypothetical protein